MKEHRADKSRGQLDLYCIGELFMAWARVVPFGGLELSKLGLIFWSNRSANRAQSRQLRAELISLEMIIGGAKQEHSCKARSPSINSI